MDFTQKSASRYILTVLASLFVITAAALLALNAYQGKLSFGAQSASYADGFQAARKLYRGMCPFISDDVRQLTGIVEANNGTSLAIEQQSLDTDPNVDHVSNLRTITISDKTVINSVQKRSPEELAKLKPAANATSTPPAPSTTTQIQLKDIQVGDTIVVSSDENLRLLSSIPAISISDLK